MTLYRRGKIWWVCYQVDNVRHRQSTHTADYRVAKVWASQIDVAKRMPTFDEAVEVLKMFYRRKPAEDEGVVAFGAAWETYLSLAKAVGKACISDDTLRKRRNAIERLAKWISRERATVKTVEGVTGPIAAGFAAHLNALGLKSKTRINVINDLNAVWKILEHASVGIRNPWTNLRPQDSDGLRGKAFTREDQERALEAARRVGRDWYEVTLTMLHTGLRYGDVARLKWSDFDGDVLRIRPHKTADHGIEVAVPIIEPLRLTLERMPKLGDYVFQTHAELYGSAIGRHTLRYRDVLEEAGIGEKGYTIHSWRHTAATRLAEAGASKDTRMQLLGHTQEATAERYDHDEHLAEKRAALERAAV